MRNVRKPLGGGSYDMRVLLVRMGWNSEPAG
jgi:hypothetical protein